MAFLRTITTEFVHTLPRTAAGFVPWHLSHTKRRESHLYGSFIKQFSSDLIHGSSDWRMIRPATVEERTFDTFHRNYSRQGICRLVFNSQKPISEEMWRKSLQHATNKMEVLRLCLQYRGENLWLCEVNNHDIDFKIIENKSVLEVLKDLKNEGLDHSFWSVHIVPANHGEVHPIPDLKQALPHQYNFLFKTHHGLMDGTTKFGYVIRVYKEILNDVLSGKSVEGDIRFGKYIFDNPLQSKIKETQQALESDPLRLNEERERMLRVINKQPILYSAYPKPKGIQSTTHHIVRKVDHSKVNTLYKCCKLKNIKMTAGFEAVFNTALVEMVRDAGAVKDEYKINIRQNINMRRYMEEEKDFKKFPLGNLVGGMQQDTYCTKEVRKYFWEHAQEIHSDFHYRLKNNGPIIESIVRPQVQGPLDPEVLAKGSPKDNSDYAFSNILDLTPFVFYKGIQVQLTDAISYNFINNFLHPMLFQFFTYRGFGQLTCSYDTAKVSDDTAHELVDRIMNVLDFVTK